MMMMLMRRTGNALTNDATVTHQFHSLCQLCPVDSRTCVTCTEILRSTVLYSGMDCCRIENLHNTTIIVIESETSLKTTIYFHLYTPKSFPISFSALRFNLT